MCELQVSLQNAKAFPELPSRSVMVRWMKKACERDTVVTVRFVDLEEGLELNKTYRHKDYATNVLTFNYALEPTVMADVAICVPVLIREPKEQNKEFRAHLAHLLIHAILHAHGYDHLNQEEAEVMEARETELMLSLKFPNPYSDRIGMVHD